MWLGTHLGRVRTGGRDSQPESHKGLWVNQWLLPSSFLFGTPPAKIQLVLPHFSVVGITSGMCWGKEKNIISVKYNNKSGLYSAQTMHAFARRTLDNLSRFCDTECIAPWNRDKCDLAVPTLRRPRQKKDAMFGPTGRDLACQLKSTFLSYIKRLQ